MNLKTSIVSKRPNLITTTPSDSTYKGLSQSELLSKVKMLHEQLLKTNKYLMEVHRLSIYNWDETDTGNIIVQLPENKEGFLLDAIVRLRGIWDPAINELKLTATDTSKRGWMYKVNTTEPLVLFGIGWKTGDYAMYDEEGTLYNVSASMLEGLFTPLILVESDTIQFDSLPQVASGIQVRASVKIDPTDENDIKASARGLYSDAYKRAKQLITIQEEAPTADNMLGGMRVVYLLEPPTTMYAGWLYLIPPATVTIEN